MLSFYKPALQHRRNLPALREGEFQWADSAPELLVFTRGSGYMCVINFASRPVPFDVPDDARIILGSGSVDGNHPAPESTFWLSLDTQALHPDSIATELTYTPR